jgi:ABC-type sugar transport system substrate-binding protein
MDTKIFKLLLLLLVLLTMQPSAFARAENFKVVFLNPGFSEDSSTGSFWSNVTLFMEAAATDLDIELVTIYAQRNHIFMKSLVEKVIAQKPKYVVLVNEKGIALDIIKQLARHDIASFMLLNKLSNKDLKLLSSKENRLLKGSVIPNNHNGGRKLFTGLINLYQTHSHNLHPNQPVKLLALQGDYTTPASIEREQGLMNTLKQNKNLSMVDSTVANWSAEQAYEKVRGIIRHTRLDIIWAANDAMAFGAQKAIEESNLDYPIYIGGINWDVDDLNYPIDLSYGGHVALGAQSLIMLKDINSNHLAPSDRHQIIDIFESSLGPFYKNFTLRLSHKKLNYYDFSRFSSSSTLPLAFTIENLSEVYNEPTNN